MTAAIHEVRGSTALLDSIGDAIKHIQNVHKYAREEDRPAKTLFIITTDGMENSGVKFSHREIKNLIEKPEKNNWEFIFLGANIDAVEVADSIGIKANRAVNYHSDSRGTAKAFDSFANFMCCAMAPEKIKLSEIDDSWREDIDEDFAERGGKKSRRRK